MLAISGWSIGTCSALARVWLYSDASDGLVPPLENPQRAKCVPAAWRSYAVFEI